MSRAHSQSRPNLRVDVVFVSVPFVSWWKVLVKAIGFSQLFFLTELSFCRQTMAVSSVCFSGAVHMSMESPAFSLALCCHCHSPSLAVSFSVHSSSQEFLSLMSAYVGVSQQKQSRNDIILVSTFTSSHERQN